MSNTPTECSSNSDTSSSNKKARFFSDEESCSDDSYEILKVERCDSHSTQFDEHTIAHFLHREIHEEKSFYESQDFGYNVDQQRRREIQLIGKKIVSNAEGFFLCYFFFWEGGGGKRYFLFFY